MKSKEVEPSCLACGKKLAAHEPLTLTCAKVHKLRTALRVLLVRLFETDSNPTAATIRVEIAALAAARKALEETA